MVVLRMNAGVYALVALVVLAVAADASTWYVSVNGVNGSGCGSESSPCADVFYTIENVASSGDTILSFPGTFHLAQGDTVTVSYNVSIAPAVPQEGPVIFDYRNLCPSAEGTFIVQNSNAGTPVGVSFNSVTFQNLKCNQQAGSALPSAILVDGSAGGAVEARLEFVDFMYNTYEVYEADERVPDTSDQVGALVKIRGSAAPASVQLVEPLFSYNQAVAAMANGTFAALEMQLGTVYNTSFYAAPAVMVVDSAVASIEAVHFQGNQFTSADASFLYVAGSNSRIFLNMTNFKDGSAPAIRFDAVAQAEILGSSFSGMLNPSGGVSGQPSSSATCVSIAQNPSFTSVYKIAGCSFTSNGAGASSGQAVIGAEGFDALAVQQSTFSGNAGAAISLDMTSPRVPLASIFSSLLAVNGSSVGIGVQSTTASLYTIDIGDVEISGASKTAIQIGSTSSSGDLYGKASIDSSSISSNAVGVTVEPSATVTIAGSTLQQNTQADIVCNGDVTVLSSQVGTVDCQASCQLAGAACS